MILSTGTFAFKMAVITQKMWSYTVVSFLPIIILITIKKDYYGQNVSEASWSVSMISYVQACVHSVSLFV